MRKAITISLFILITKALIGQPCTNTGQTPSSAILLCGAASFAQPSVPQCGQINIPVPCPATSSYQNMNPTWFRMNCFTSGTFGFIISPDDATDNYDWQLYDISGRSDDDVLTDPSLFLAGNWCADPGETGASTDGNNSIVCTGTANELFSKMPNIIQGHEYLLLVSHRNSSETGFQIVLTGGSGSVTDPIDPALFNARLNCNSNQITVLLNKRMVCATVSGNGSEFTFSGPATITGAAVQSCTNAEASQIVLTLSNSVPPGSYTLTINPGSDGNTIRDRCNRFIPDGNSVPVILPSLLPVTMDSLTTPVCAPASLKLFFEKPIRCSSIAGDGSDFTVTGGTQPVTISGISVICNGSGTTVNIEVRLSSPIVRGGTYQINLVNGTDGNALIDECGAPVPPGFISFTLKDTVSAIFNYTIDASCKEDTIYFSHNGLHGVTDWIWTFDNTPASNSASQMKIYPATGQHKIQLIVSNGFCKDTTSETIVLDNKVVAAFEGPDIICPEDTVRFVNKSTGTVDEWRWTFGNSIISTIHTPPIQHYPINNRETFYTVKLIAASNAMNCRDSATRRIQVLGSCYIAVPTAFTPNGDGLNDFLHPTNALKAENLEFRVYNRFGQLVFQTKDWTRKWDGRINGQAQSTGVYAWLLSFTHRDTKQKIFMKGTTVLIR
jgi:gliding motility-associated-like protein